MSHSAPRALRPAGRPVRAPVAIAGLLGLLGLLAPTRAAAQSGVELHDLGGGASLVAVPDPDATRAEFRVVLELGAGGDPTSSAARAYLLGHALAATAGLSASVQSRPDRLALAAASSPESAAVGLAEIARALADPARVAESLESARASASAPAEHDRHELAEAAIWRASFGVDLHRALRPTEAGLASCAPADLEAFQRAHAGRDRLVFGWSGPGDTAALADSLREALEELPPASSERAPALSPLLSGRLRLFVVDDPGPGPIELRVMCPVAPYPSPVHLASRVWGALLEVPPRRLPAHLESMGVAADIELESLGDPLLSTHVLVRGRVEAEAAARAVEGILVALDDARMQPAPVDLESARELVRSAERERAAHPGATLDRALELALLGLEPADPWPGLAPDLLRLDPESIVRTSLATSSPLQTIVLAVGPADELRPALARIAPVMEVRSGELTRTPEGEAAAARMLEALGGGATWSKLRAIRCAGTEEVRLSDTVTSPQTFERWLDLERSRLRVQTRFRFRTTITVLDGVNGWERGPVRRDELSAGRCAGLRAARARELPVLLRALAAGAELSLAIDEDGRLVVGDATSEICALRLGANGRPVEQTWTDEAGAHVLRLLEWVEVELEPATLLLPRTYETGAAVRGEFETWEPLPELPPELFR